MIVAGLEMREVYAKSPVQIEGTVSATPITLPLVDTESFSRCLILVDHSKAEMSALVSSTDLTSTAAKAPSAKKTGFLLW